MDNLHWQMLRDNARDNAGDSDMYCAFLGNLGRSNINRNNPICVPTPKVAKASKQDCCCHQRYQANFCQWKQSFRGVPAL
jgi:hypothetical protein